MLLELVQCGDLWPYIYRKKVPKFRDALPRSEHGNFEYADAKFYTANLVCALEYIHSLGIAYRDLKPEVKGGWTILHTFTYIYTCTTD
jgi:serine/threonine protein kinase